MLADAVRFKMIAPQGWVIFFVRVRRVAVSQPFGQVLGVIARVGGKKLEKADSFLLALDVGDCGGSHGLACQFPIEGLSLLILCLGVRRSPVILLISASSDGEG